MTSNLDAFVGRLTQAANGYATLPRIQVEGIAKTVTSAIRASIDRAAPGGRMRGVGKRGARVGARYDVTGPQTAFVKATGPLHLLERDTKEHVIPKERARGRRQGRPVLKIGDRFVTGPIAHPGTKGKHPFEKAVVATQPLTGPIAHKAVNAMLSRIYR